MCLQMLCLHMFARHVVLVGFVVIMVISLTLWCLGIDVVIRESD
jgi:hypothetical protein